MTTVEKNVSLHEIDEESRNMAEQPMFTASGKAAIWHGAVST